MKEPTNFSFDFFGDIGLDRPNLGHNVRVEIYRLMQYAITKTLGEEYGTERAQETARRAGRWAGEVYCYHFLKDCSSFNSFIKQIQESLAEMGIGILRVEKSDLETNEFVLTVSEDVSCSGMSPLGYEVCNYDEGFLAGILASYTKIEFDVAEVDCWCSGSKTCRFVAKPKTR